MLLTNIDSHVFDNLLDGVILLDASKNIVYANEAFAKIIDTPIRRLKKGKALEDFIHLDENIWSLTSLENKTEDTSTYKEISFQKLNGESVLAQISVQIMTIDNQKYFLIYVRDVSLENILQKKYRTELEEKDKYIQQLDRKLFEVQFMLDISSLQSEYSLDGPILIDEVLKKLVNTFPIEMAAYFTSQKSENLIEFNLQSFLGKPGVDHRDFRDEISCFLREPKHGENSLKDNKIQSIQTEDVSCVIAPVKGRTSDFGVFLLRSSPKQSTQLNSYSDLLHGMAKQIGISLENTLLYFKSITDEMTKLFNNRYFKYTLEREIQRCSRIESKFALVLIDVDHFKKFNDTYGHQTGDLVLKRVAQSIKKSCRTTDVAARYGGEEFAVILIDTDKTGAVGVAERIRTEIESTQIITKEHGTLNVTASLGVSIFPEHGSNDMDLIEAADIALYQAKNRGRNRTILKT